MIYNFIQNKDYNYSLNLKTFVKFYDSMSKTSLYYGNSQKREQKREGIERTWLKCFRSLKWSLSASATIQANENSSKFDKKKVLIFL